MTKYRSASEIHKERQILAQKIEDDKRSFFDNFNENMRKLKFLTDEYENSARREFHKAKYGEE